MAVRPCSKAVSAGCCQPLLALPCRCGDMQRLCWFKPPCCNPRWEMGQPAAAQGCALCLGDSLRSG